MPSERSRDLHALAQRVVDALPREAVEEAVLTGSVSRGVADAVSDIEMLLVTPDELTLEQCFALAREAGLEELDSWGDRATATRRVFGYREGVPVETIWWSRALAEETVDSMFRGQAQGSAEALAHGVPLRTAGALARWQKRLAEVPEALAREQIEDAALTWGGFAPAGLLTIARPGEDLARLERMLDDAARVLRIVYALNRVWPRTHKRLASRVESLRIKPDRLAQRLDEAFAERDPRRALLVLTQLQADTVALAPDGPNVSRARVWLAAGAELLAGDDEAAPESGFGACAGEDLNLHDRNGH